ncbi:MAG: family 20 glycosylhydrolase [Paramuribaculum sp.]|nr:family 20 glycosylhydrolase [Paramuribaculum sp.]
MKHSKSLLLSTLLTAALPLGAYADINNLMPLPKTIVEGSGNFLMSGGVVLQDPSESTLLKEFINNNNLSIDPSAKSTISVKYVESISGARNYELDGYPDEAYTLTVKPESIEITAITSTGVIRATQTLAQLAEGANGSIPAVTIVDWPAFKLRGFMHDVGRSFVSFETLKKHIDLLSRFKVNTFHWHLTENQAWRFEVKAYPQLTSSESMTRFAGQYYTQEQCRELDRYAAERGITIIPEIDMPGHSQAFERAMGHSMQTDKGVAELQVILEEVAATFPNAPYIHIGADEQTITYPNFLKIMTDKVHSLGHKVVVWNPIRGVEIGPSKGFDLLTNWSTAGVLKPGMPNIDMRYNYINHFDVFADLVGIYRSNIFYSQEGNQDIAGAMVGMWNDRKLPDETQIIAQNNFYANVLATAERAWKGGGKQYIETGGAILPNSGEEYDEFADWEKRFLYHKAHSLDGEPIPYVKQTNVRWRITDPFPNNGNKNLTLPPETEEPAKEYIYKDKTYSSRIATGAGIYLRHTWGTTVPAVFTNTGDNVTAYAYTYIYSPEETEAGALIEFQNYSRSENDQAPVKGNWDRKGSRIWLNDEELKASSWINAGKSINSEVDLRDENFPARAPYPVTLKKGWNKVMIKLPYVSASGVRLNKWLFTFVITDKEGKNALDGLIYSPSKIIDQEAEILDDLITEYKTRRNSYIGTLPGYYPESLAAEFDKVLEEISATLTQEATPEQRKEQSKKLTEAFNAFLESITPETMNQPVEETVYTLSTPLRGNRFATSSGAGKAMTGNASPSDNSNWKFEKRSDGTFNIINEGDRTYVSPTASYNTAITTTSSVPSAGWEIFPTNQPGYVIVASGTTQWNQTNASLGYKIYNWSSQQDGRDITDTGCTFLFAEAEQGETPEAPQPIATITNISLSGNSPYKVPDNIAAQIFKAKAVTTAIDYEMESEFSDFNSIVASSDTVAPRQYFTLASKGGKYAFRAVWKNDKEDQYTRSSNGGTTGRHTVVMIADPDQGFSLYIDKLDPQTIDVTSLGDYGLMTYADKGSNAITLGGIITASNRNLYPLAGTIHSVRFFDRALTAQEINSLSYTGLTNSSISDIISDSFLTPHSGIFDLSGRLLKAADTTGLDSGIYIVDGKKLLVR